MSGPLCHCAYAHPSNGRILCQPRGVTTLLGGKGVSANVAHSPLESLSRYSSKSFVHLFSSTSHGRQTGLERFEAGNTVQGSLWDCIIEDLYVSGSASPAAPSCLPPPGPASAHPFPHFDEGEAVSLPGSMGQPGRAACPMSLHNGRELWHYLGGADVYVGACPSYSPHRRKAKTNDVPDRKRCPRRNFRGKLNVRNSVGAWKLS